MSNRRVCVAITARPSYSRIRAALQVLRASSEVDLQVLCSASALLDRYGRIVDLIREDGFDVIEELYTFVEGNEPINMALTTANTIQHTAPLFKRIDPDCVVTVADRYETLGTAVSAAYLGIPLIHVQGGELSGNIDERVRHAVTKLSDFHLVSNEHARERLIRMGEQPKSIHVTGCPSVDLAREAIEIPLQRVQETIDSLGVGEPVHLRDKYLVVLQHPETDSFEQSYERMRMTLNVVQKAGLPALVFWPNVDAGSDATSKAIRVFREAHPTSPIRYMKNLEGHVFLRLLADAQCLIGNSSVGVRESGYLGTPVINIGDRQIGRDRSENTVDCGWDETKILDNVMRQMAAGKYARSTLYGDGHAGRHIGEIIRTIDLRKRKRFYES